MSDLSNYVSSISILRTAMPQAVRKFDTVLLIVPFEESSLEGLDPTSVGVASKYAHVYSYSQALGANDDTEDSLSTAALASIRGFFTAGVKPKRLSILAVATGGDEDTITSAISAYLQLGEDFFYVISTYRDAESIVEISDAIAAFDEIRIHVAQSDDITIKGNEETYNGGYFGTAFESKSVTFGIYSTDNAEPRDAKYVAEISTVDLSVSCPPGDMVLTAFKDDNLGIAETVAAMNNKWNVIQPAGNSNITAPGNMLDGTPIYVPISTAYWSSLVKAALLTAKINKSLKKIKWPMNRAGREEVYDIVWSTIQACIVSNHFNKEEDNNVVVAEITDEDKVERRIRWNAECYILHSAVRLVGTGIIEL